ncbi:hypothetical protein GYA54_02005 [Candidatus Kuenenbacteria bacterium]|nr:hypothetical protein [Candidatus Kuenenbacteria bacterium]
MKISAQQAKEKKLNNSTTIWEYDLPSKNLSFSRAHINGRFPQKGLATNSECEEIYYIVGGSGTVHSKFGDFEINKGDIYHFIKGEKYWTEGRDLAVVLFNSPRWTPEQFKEII